MAADLKHMWTVNNVFQGANSTKHWTWQVGEGDDYWGYSVRPAQNNSDFEIVQQFTTTDNFDHWTEHFIVKTNSGGLLRISGIRVVGA